MIYLFYIHSYTFSLGIFLRDFTLQNSTPKTSMLQIIFCSNQRWNLQINPRCKGWWGRQSGDWTRILPQLETAILGTKDGSSMRLESQSASFHYHQHRRQHGLLELQLTFFHWTKTVLESDEWPLCETFLELEWEE